LAALVHSAALFPLAFGALLAGTVYWGVGLAAFFTGEIFLVVALPRFRSFRKMVDARAERAAAVAVRAGMLARMSPFHRAELAQLERLALAVRDSCGRRDACPLAARERAAEDWLELERLLALYMQLAIVHLRNAEVFRAEHRTALEIESEQVKRIAYLRRGPADAWLERRCAVLQRRRETWAQATYEGDVLLQELGTISDVVWWMYELCALAPGDVVRSEVEDVLASWESNGATLREVSAFCRADETVDPYLLALGREEMARAAEEVRRLGITASPPSTRRDQVRPVATSAPALEPILPEVMTWLRAASESDRDTALRAASLSHIGMAPGATTSREPRRSP
jgi:hypothetical protein